MQKVIFLLGLLIVSSHWAKAQLLYPIVGACQGKSAQDMAIYGDNAYLMSDGGYCRVLNLLTGALEKNFHLACSNKKPHINAVCFGSEKLEDADIPVIYVSATDKPHCCYVESLTKDSSKTVQTIEAMENGKLYANHNWIVDDDNAFLYGLKCFWHQYIDDVGNVKTVITKYRLPKLDEGEKVVLSEKDILDRFDVFFPNALQGVAIRKGKLYIASGMQEKERNNTETERAIIVIDLKKKKIVKKVNINLLTTNEPEGIAFYYNKCLLFCGQTGGLYRVSL